MLRIKYAIDRGQRPGGPGGGFAGGRGGPGRGEPLQPPAPSSWLSR